MIVVDYTSRIPPTALRAANVVGVCRYLSLPIARTAYKRIGQAEYDELIHNGFDVTLNWEFDARDWLAGTTSGKSHGTQAAQQANALGYPHGKVIIGSADFDMTRAQWLNGGRAYAKAFAKAVREGGYRPGVYGPWDVLQWVSDENLMDAFWQAGMSTAWSAGRNRHPWPGAHLRQRAHLTIGGTDTDWNEILIPKWGIPEETEPDMPFLAHDALTDTYYVCDLMVSREIHPDDFPHVLYLAQQLNYAHGSTSSPVEWTHDGWVREGWTEGRFGTLQDRFIAPTNQPQPTPGTRGSTVAVTGTLTLTPTETE